MNLSELKSLMGIGSEDTSQDAILSLYLESALEMAKGYADKYDFTSTAELPGPIKLGIVKWIELTRLREERQGVQSESIGGMSQTFVNSANDTDYFSSVFNFWKPYHSNKLVYRTVKRKDRANIDYLIPEDVTITGTRKL